MFKSYICIICTIILFMQLYTFNRQTVINKNIDNIIDRQHKILSEMTINQHELQKYYNIIIDMIKEK